MAEQTAIAWTDHTANFWMGCEKISPGCAHCYAETLTQNRMGLTVWGAGSKRQEVKGIWANLRKWDREAAIRRERARVFVMSLGDFMEDHADVTEVRRRAWDTIRGLEWLDVQILTKRPENYDRFLPSNWSADRYPHVWLGTSVENNRHVFRLDILRKLEARVHFVSLEPLIGAVPDLDLTHIEWAIIGGESGPGFRPMRPEWVEEIEANCRRMGTAFFYKQSAAFRTEMGIKWNGRIVREYPSQALPTDQRLPRVA